MKLNKLTRDAILKVGAVSEVRGRVVTVKVDKNKNLSDLFLDGEILRNIAVNSYVEIRKGFLRIIGKVDGEKIEEEPIQYENAYEEKDRNRRYLTISLIGFIGSDGSFTAGMKELPLIGNEAYIVTKETIDLIHDLVSKDELHINIAETDEGFPIRFPVDSLFNGHIAIFGNTGSGKSNTLAALYESLLTELTDGSQRGNKSHFKENMRFLLFDFNGEYTQEECITSDKTVYNLSTSEDSKRKIPLSEDDLLDLEMLSILSNATEKTQKPFLSRTIDYYKNHVRNKDNPEVYFKGILRNQIQEILTKDDPTVQDLGRYISIILPKEDENGNEVNVFEDIKWIPPLKQYIRKDATEKDQYFNIPKQTHNTKMYNAVKLFKFPENPIKKFIKVMYVKLIEDILNHKVQNEYVAPVIRRFESKQNDIEKVFDTKEDDQNNKEFWENNFIVINLNHVNLEMKKTIPLLLSKILYSDHKRGLDDINHQRSLNMIIDEAHNILSHTSSRESESWKDYRLETFEEIIKEGRKFGVFVTIASQRPSDISETITSQAHNYFIHRLINQYDLKMISSAVSYIDRMTEESIPTLPTGTCIFSGIASQRPIKVQINKLPRERQPKSHTLQFSNIINRDDEPDNSANTYSSSPPDDVDDIPF